MLQLEFSEDNLKIFSVKLQTVQLLYHYAQIVLNEETNGWITIDLSLQLWH